MLSLSSQGVRTESAVKPSKMRTWGSPSLNHGLHYATKPFQKCFRQPNRTTLNALGRKLFWPGYGRCPRVAPKEGIGRVGLRVPVSPDGLVYNEHQWAYSILWRVPNPNRSLQASEIPGLIKPTQSSMVSCFSSKDAVACTPELIYRCLSEGCIVLIRFIFAVV